MLKLIRLEIKKFKLLSYTRGVIISNLIIMAMLCLIYFQDKSNGSHSFANYQMAFDVIGSMVRAVFVIFASALIARLIIDEYKSRSITLLFTYPVSRKKIMGAKLAIVACFTFSAILFSTLVIGSLFYLVDSYVHFVPIGLSAGALGGIAENAVVGALAFTGISLIPLYFGMRKKSGPATIISAILLVALTNSTIDTTAISSIAAVSFILALVGGFIAYLSIRNAEKADIN